MVKGLVSIIITTYKTNDSILKSIDSALHQSYKNIEIIVVDDNDPKSEYRIYTENLVKKYSKFNNVKFIFHKKNMNGSTARNTGASAANGEYLSFLDDDDYYLENKILCEIELLKKNDLDFCSCYYYRNNKVYTFPIKNDYTEDVFFNKIVPQTSSFFLKKKCFDELKGFDVSYFRHQDYEFLLRICKKYKIGIVDKPLYVRDSNGINNVPNGHSLELLKDKFLSDFDYLINNHQLNKKKIYAKNYSIVLFSYLKEKNNKKAIEIIKKYNNIYFWGFFIKKIFMSIKYKVRG